jgi:hypothetical protein
MAKSEIITRDALVKGMEAGKTSAQLATELGVSVMSINNKKIKLGLTRRQLSHKWAVPWTLNALHKKSTFVQYLWALSTAAQTDNFSGGIVNIASKWALDLIERERDITYDPDYGFIVVTADQTRWHIKMVMEAAINGELPKDI